MKTIVFNHYDVLLNWILYHNKGIHLKMLHLKGGGAGRSQQKGGLRMGTKKGGRALPSRRKRATLIFKNHSLMVALDFLITLILFFHIPHTILYA
jgi:hypothetical protein